MKERFIKKILPFIDRYDLSERELKRFRQLGSAKAGTFRLLSFNKLHRSPVQAAAPQLVDMCL